MSPVPYLLSYLLAALVVVGTIMGGGFNYIAFLFAFAIIPILDLLIGTDSSNATPEKMAELEQKQSFRLIALGHVPIQVVLVVWAASVAGSNTLSGIAMLGFVLSVGTATGGIGITVAHELFHKKNRIDALGGKILLLTVSYMHFYIEHLIGHHVHVATPKDPVTARYGESFYRFYPRAVVGSFRSAWQIETRRLARKGTPVWSPHNQMLWFVALPIVFAIALGWAFGWRATTFFFAQSIVAFTLLEIVNYIEHYGLLRKRKPSGNYERVAAAHSWNADHRMTNYFLFRLQRHADHHIHPLRPYQVLRHFDESPQLPTGYAGMIVLALFPPLWHRLMDERAASLQMAP